MIRNVLTRLLLPALLLTACSDALGPDPEPITELPRALTASERAIIQNGNTFGLSLVREMVARDDRTNVILSPLSASMALAMTLNGAAEGTFDAMQSTLGFQGMTQEQINDAYHGLMELLTTLDPQVRFDIANSVWANQDIAIHETFLQAVEDAFAAQAESRDFSDPATATAVNDWVSDKTGGLIPTIVDQLSPSMVMLLINAIYFDGAWTTRFDPDDTQRYAFHREDGSTVQVDMMTRVDAEVARSDGPGYSAVELPYGGEAYSMVVVVPEGTTDVRAFLAGLDGDRWNDILDGFTLRTQDLLGIPRFTLDYDGYLNDALDAMGMGVAFRPGADFTRLSPGGKSMCISYVRQKTYVEVNERGTRAAAVTSVDVRLTSSTAFIVDRPFVFAIRERLSDTLLFVGMVGDPTAEDPGTEMPANLCS